MKTLLIIFAKHPQIGKVKRRLGRDVGMEASLWIYNKILQHTAKISFHTKFDTVVFKNKKSSKLESIFKHVKKFEIQKGKNLGEKMEAAFLWAFDQKYENVILIGTDLWTLNKDTLLEAKKALENTDIVIGPCYDGGYYLIGMKNLNKKIFKDIPWSKKEVFRKTLSKAKDNSIYCLDLKNDIDNKKSLKAHISLYAQYKKYFHQKS
jgi:rSAM/selenodomain-associated transferase 1